MGHFNGREIHTAGLAFFTDRLMGGPILPLQFYLRDTSEMTAVFRDTDLEMNAAMPRSCEHVAQTAVVKVESNSDWEKRVHNMLCGNQSQAEMKSLFEYSVRNTCIDFKHEYDA